MICNQLCSAAGPLPPCDAFCKALLVSPMDMDVGDVLLVGCKWISSHYLHFYADGSVSILSGQLDLLPIGAYLVPARSAML